MCSLRAFKYIIQTAVLIVTVLFFASCDKKDPDIGIETSEEGINHTYPGDRLPIEETRRVLLFYECGFNSLNYDLSANMEQDLPMGFIPGGGRHDDVLLVFSKIALNANYKDVPSYLRRIYTDNEGNIISDTLKVFSTSTVASSPTTMSEVLNMVKSTFPAKGYGMVFSSHGSGWLPTGYYNSPSNFEREFESDGRKLLKARRAMDIPEGIMERDDPHAWMVRSIGQDKMSSGDVEMTAAEFAGGIPYRLDFLLFDMCFSGGIEIIYALKDKADYLGVSPAEVLAAGMFDYRKITTFVFKNSEPDLEGLFKDSFQRYDQQQGDYRSVTVNLIKTEGLDALAQVCGRLITKYSDALASVRASQVQGYFRMNRHYFYDLVDIFAKSGVSDEDMAALRDAMNRCVVYKAATPYFISEIEIKTYSGISMYLPCAGTSLLDSYYKDEPWNKAVGLVK